MTSTILFNLATHHVLQKIENLFIFLISIYVILYIFQRIYSFLLLFYFLSYSELFCYIYTFMHNIFYNKHATNHFSVIQWIMHGINIEIIKNDNLALPKIWYWYQSTFCCQNDKTNAIWYLTFLFEITICFYGLITHANGEIYVYISFYECINASNFCI